MFSGWNAHAQFLEKSASMGINQFHRNALLVGGGATFFDYNLDGFIDLYVTGGGESDRLYHNYNNERFIDVSLRSKIWNYTKSRLTSGVISGDINNDGCIDLFLTTSDASANLLLINNCDGTFTNQAVSYDVLDTSRSMGAAFLDVNQDGYLDIYVLNYIENSKFTYDDNNDVNGYAHECYPNFLYLSKGNLTFEESAEIYGVNNIGCSLAVAASDIDGDGYTDLYLANDYGEWVKPNAAYISNYPNIGFTDSSSDYGLGLGVYGMGIAIGDPDKNRRKDYYVTNIGKNSLLSQKQSRNFYDISESSNVGNEKMESGHNVTSWGTFFFDYDNDMDEDLFVSNGFIGTAPFLNTSKTDPNKLYENDGSGVFFDVSKEMSIDSDFYNRGAIYGDYDNDGDLDIFCATIDGVIESDQHSLLFQNQSRNNNNWIQFSLEGTIVNRDGYGALLKVFIGNSISIRELYSSGSFASQSSTIVHFGLADNESIDSVEVKWDVNHSQIFKNPPINQRIYLKQGASSFEILGCMDKNNPYFNEMASRNYACYSESLGCTDILASNYVPNALVDDESCFYGTVTNIIDDQESNINVFPNQFEDKLNITLSEPEGIFNVFLLNINGITVAELNTKGSSNLEIETRGLPSGVYFLRVVDQMKNEIVGVHKVMKK